MIDEFSLVHSEFILEAQQVEFVLARVCEVTRVFDLINYVAARRFVAVDGSGVWERTKDEVTIAGSYIDN